MNFVDPHVFVDKKCIRSKKCPDCGCIFYKNESGYMCAGCDLELNLDGEPKSYFYGIVSIDDKWSDIHE